MRNMKEVIKIIGKVPNIKKMKLMELKAIKLEHLAQQNKQL